MINYFEERDFFIKFSENISINCKKYLRKNRAEFAATYETTLLKCFSNVFMRRPFALKKMIYGSHSIPYSKYRKILGMYKGFQN